MQFHFVEKKNSGFLSFIFYYTRILESSLVLKRNILKSSLNALLKRYHFKVKYINKFNKRKQSSVMLHLK